MRRTTYTSLFFRAMLFLGVCIAPLTAYRGIDNRPPAHKVIITQELLEDCSERIETYLQQQVPGLHVSYREVIDTLNQHGIRIYLKGGILRDLLSDPIKNPNDVDFDYLGKREDLLAILDRHHWTYTATPKGRVITIGMREGHFMEGGSADASIFAATSVQEFTLNYIVYDTVTRQFLSRSLIGIQDLRENALRVTESDLENWLHGGEESDSHYFCRKVFRFWKMAGLGYRYSPELADLVVQETLDSYANDPQDFEDAFVSYLKGHMASCGQLFEGCRKTMGQAWAEKIVLANIDRARKEQAELFQELDTYTFHRSCVQED